LLSIPIGDLTMATSTKLFVLMNVFTPKPGKLNELVAAQPEALANLNAGGAGARAAIHPSAAA
jgi:hypothetical protein